MISLTSNKPVGPEDFGPKFRSLYADLVFVYLWSAVAQLVLAVVSLACLMLIGNSTLSPPGFALNAYMALIAMVSSTSFALAQLGSCLKALGDVARQRDAYLRSDLLARSRNADMSGHADEGSH